MRRDTCCDPGVDQMLTTTNNNIIVHDCYDKPCMFKLIVIKNNNIF